MVREIGGYLEFERFTGEPYHKDAIALNSGRGCLSYLVELREIRSIWIPDLMCESVFDLLKREQVEVRTYPINVELLPDYNSFDIAGDEWLMLMDYYGQLQQEDVIVARSAAGGRLIVDESQGFFRRPWDGIDTTYTCRKWFGVADGGYLATGNGETLARMLPIDESHDRMGFVLGRYERSAGEFFAQSSKNNARFAGEPAKRMSLITENIMRAIDYEAVRARRLSNWRVLHETLAPYNGLEPSEPECPFMYPLYLGECAQDVRVKLIEGKVFVPMLWPNVPAETPEDSFAHNYAAGILPLPLDQRYCADDMKRIIEIIERSI